MRKYFLFVLVLLLAGCSSTRYITKTEREVKVSERTEMVPYMVKVEIPETRIERTVRDTVSELETPFAVSTARILSDGSLYHDLEDKAQTIEKETEVPIVYRDSIVYETKEVTKEVQVARKLTWWQRVRLDGFFILLAALLVVVFWNKIASLVKSLWQAK